VSKKAFDGVQSVIQHETKEMDHIISLKKKDVQDAQALAEQKQKENDARFVCRIDQLTWYIL
jgi:hypothetical protein